MIEVNDIVAIGKFQKTHALKGELNAILEIDSEFLEEGNAIIAEIDGIYVPFYIKSIRKKGSSSFLIQIDGIDSEDEARVFVNKTIYAEKSSLASFLEIDDEDLFDSDDLIGYSIYDSKSGKEIGKIIFLDTSTQNALFVVETEDGNEIFIPAADDLIIKIDDENKIVEMTLPEGIIDINTKY